MSDSYTVFAGSQRIARGPIAFVAVAAQAWLGQGGEGVLVFDDETGRALDLDLRGTPAEAVSRLQDHPALRRPAPPVEEEARHGRGRPKLGVVSREVSLLPRHWTWLADQPGGASAALRRLVEERMKASAGRDRARKAYDAAQRFAWAVAGNLPGFEEAMRALGRHEHDRFTELVAPWPPDVRDHMVALVEAAREAERA